MYSKTKLFERNKVRGQAGWMHPDLKVKAILGYISAKDFYLNLDYDVSTKTKTKWLMDV